MYHFQEHPVKSKIHYPGETVFFVLTEVSKHTSVQELTPYSNSVYKILYEI